MRLAYLSAAKIPSREANSIHVMKMCVAFAQQGHSVTLLAPEISTGVEPEVSDVFSFYGVRPNFELRKIPWRSVKGRGLLYGLEAGLVAKSFGAQAAFGRSLHACAVTARLKVPTIWDVHMLTFITRWHERRLFRWMIGARAFRHVTVNCASLG